MSSQVIVVPQQTMPAMPAMTAMPASGERSPAVTISSEILVAAIVVLFMVVVFVFFLYLYARRYLGPQPLVRRGRSGTRLVFAADFEVGAAHARRGLDPAVLAALPVVVVGGGEGEEEKEMECAVCLCEVAEGEEARILPKCNHGFHVGCIDMWLHSHSTCPLCRSPVGLAEASPSPARTPAPEPAEPPIFPTNVLFWGTQDRINAGNSSETSSSSPSSSSSSRTRGRSELVIEIPTRAMEGSPSPISPLPVSQISAEEMKSPPPPPPPSSARLRSLRRLLSRGKQAMGGSSCSPRGGDIEQGNITPRTPTS